MTDSKIIGIRFQKVGKLYHFDASNVDDLVPGDHVIVETRRGKQLGQVIAYIDPEEIHRRKGIRAVQRKANPRDMVMNQVWETKELDALITCREQASKANTRGKTVFINAAFTVCLSLVSWTTPSTIRLVSEKHARDSD